MSSAIFPHTETVNYTKGLMLLHVPGMLTLCFMASTVKTRSVLKLSRSSLPSLQFYLSCSFREGTKARSRSQNSHQPPLNASDINLLSLSLFVKVATASWVTLESDTDKRQAGSPRQIIPATSASAKGRKRKAQIIMTLYSLLAEDKSLTFESNVKEYTRDWNKFNKMKIRTRGLASLSAKVVAVLTVSAGKMTEKICNK